MNILVSCPLCSRQYRAEESQISKRYYCRCGSVVVVPDPKTSHESRVVRCSSCGAPREEQSEHCSSCNSDFTIHEQDVNTVCPGCLARISDAARYCNHCGIEISATPMGHQSTSENCPVCETRKLQQRPGETDNLPFAECEVCAGLWLTKEVFNRVLKRARDQGLDGSLATLFPKTYVIGGKTENDRGGPFYRKCPDCQQLMIRKLFPGAPVILDLCTPHGIWFDAGELEKIMGLVRQGLQPGVSNTPIVLRETPIANPQRPYITPREEFSFVRNILDYLLSKVMG